MTTNSEIKYEKSWKLERHIQTGLTAVVIALVLWAGTTINNQTTQIAVFAEKLVSVEKRVDIFTQQPRFSKDDFKIEMQVFDARLSFIETELNNRKNFMNEIDSRTRLLERHKDFLNSQSDADEIN